MATLPPWLQITPETFLASIRGGADSGQRVAGMRTEANIAGARIASDEAQNAARIQAQMAANASQAGEAAAALDLKRQLAQKDFELAKMGLTDKEKAREAEAEQMGIDFGLKSRNLDLSERKQDELERLNAARLKEQERKASLPTYRTVGNSLVEITPAGGTRELFQAPYRPQKESTLDRLLSLDSRPAASAAQPSGGRIPVVSPDGTPGTVSAESLEEALAQGYKRL